MYYTSFLKQYYGLLQYYDFNKLVFLKKKKKRDKCIFPRAYLSMLYIDVCLFYLYI